MCGAVERCRKAGIELKMLTGDNIVTATAIANELGILDERHIAVEARQIEEMSDEELSREIGRIRVIARSTPVIKMRVVNALKAQGNVVAVTGDGINDAPAIKNADVGIAMGGLGSDAAIETADVVIQTDQPGKVATALRIGRRTGKSSGRTSPLPWASKSSSAARRTGFCQPVGSCLCRRRSGDARHLQCTAHPSWASMKRPFRYAPNSLSNHGK